MRRTLATLGLLAVLAAGATGCALLGGEDTAPEDSPSAAAGQASDGGTAREGEDGSEPAAENTDENTAEPVLLEETIAQSELGVAGATLTFEVKGVTANAHGTTLHAVITAAYLEDGACLCTEVPNSLDDGDSLPLVVQYAPLPEGTRTVTVGADKFGAFAHVPVTWT